MARKAGLLKNIGQAKDDFVEGFKADYGIGSEDARGASYRKRELEGRQKEAPKIEAMLESYPMLYRLRELSRTISPEAKQALYEQDMALQSDKSKAFVAGQMAGTVAADLTQDATRRFYWLLNAAQATGEVVNEYVLSKAQPNLYGKSIIYDEKGNPYKQRNSEKAVKDGYVKSIKNSAGQEEFIPARGVQWDKENKAYTKRNFEPGDIQALAIPTGIAINNAMGLLTPFGGAEGYKAASPSEEDPTKTDNIAAEIALKYIMGRTGNLLPYNEFVKVRPDVSPQEYAAYQAFKYDKNTDLDITDGDVGLPGGALKFTTEGIHGPELQFLGRSLPTTTGLVPYLGALAGGVAGVRTKRPIKGGLLGGLGGLALGTLSGNLLEQERRRRNLEENLEDGTIRQ